MRWRDLLEAAKKPMPVLAVAGLCAVLFLFGGAISSDPQGMFGQVTAAWVQAVGSVGAIVFAWWQGQRAAQIADREKRAAILRFLGGLAAMTDQALRHTAVALGALERDDFKTFGEIAVPIRDHVVSFSKLAELPVQNWPTPTLATALELALENLREVSERLPVVISAVRKKSLVPALRQDFRERVEVFRWRATNLHQQVMFNAEIYGEGPGPYLRFVTREDEDGHHAETTN